MKHPKNYFIISLLILSAYLIQRSLLFLTDSLDFDEMLVQSQVEGKPLGISITFSYFGMHIFWPIIISVCILGYLYSKKISNSQGVLFKIHNSGIIRFLLVVLIPLFALSLHFYTILGFFVEKIDLALMGENQQGLPVPDTSERVASIVVVILILISFIISILSLFIATFKRK